MVFLENHGQIKEFLKCHKAHLMRPITYVMLLFQEGMFIISEMCSILCYVALNNFKIL